MAGHLPLYKGAGEVAQLHPTAEGPPVWAGNAGLWYDKFCDRWLPDFTGFPEPPKSDDRNGTNAKLDWIDSLAYPRGWDGVPDRTKPPVKTGDPALLTEMMERRKALAHSRGGLVLDFALTSRLLTGMGRHHPTENGVAWHHSLGVPYLAGSAVKGVLRTTAERAPGGEPVCAKLLDRLFGPRLENGQGSLHRGALLTLDALPVRPVQMVAEVMTPHTVPWNLADPVSPDFALDKVPADWHSPNPITFAAVEADATYQFVILPGPVPRLEQGEEWNWQVLLPQVAGWLKQALTDLGAGAKTASGYGRFVPAEGGGTPHIHADPDVTLPPPPHAQYRRWRAGGDT